MQDGLGREIDYLRISVTDKCNLRCRYCMPPQGITPLAHEEILTLEEIFRLVGIMEQLGIRKVRLTGKICRGWWSRSMDCRESGRSP